MGIQPDLEQARTYARTRLGRELSPALAYHTLSHSLDEVAAATARLAALENVSAPDYVLLLTAAYLHDLGFVERYLENEVVAARIAAETLPTWGYTPPAVEAVCGMIMATRLPQTPRTRFEQILADADLEVLGRSDFMTRNLDLRRERAAFGYPAGDADWFGGQLRFLESHAYFTVSARSLLDAGKRENIARLRECLAQTAP